MSIRVIVLSVALLVLNAYDAAATLVLVAHAECLEANPLMAAALDYGPLVFLAVKAALVCGSLATLLVVAMQSPRAASVGQACLVTAVIAYAAVCVYHSMLLPLVVR